MLLVSVLLGIFLLILILGCYFYVQHVSANSEYGSIKKIPVNRVGVVLGTNPISRLTGKRNVYYQFRLDATVALYKAGKIKRVLVSGDNGCKEYSEPDAMKKDLAEMGIPAEHIYLDYAGFRTLDSVVRAKEVFGLQEFTVISQKFHNERAICIARWKGMSVIGFNARKIRANAGVKTNLRECLARVKCVLDMLTNKQPRFLGNKIEIK